MHRTVLSSLVVALLLLLAAPAMASHPYVGSASARGLELSIAGQEIEVGLSEAAVQSGPSEDGCGSARGNACASAVGARGITEAAAAHAPGSPGPRDAIGLPLPAALAPLLTGQVGAARAEATTASHTGSARGTAGGLGVTFRAPTAVVDDGGLQAAVEAIVATLPVDTGDDAVLAALRVALDQLVVDLPVAPLLNLSGGSSAAAAADTGGVTTATASTGDTVLVVAPTARSTPEAPEGLVVVQIDKASVEARSDQRTGRTTVAAPAVTLSVYDPVTRTHIVEEIPAGGSSCAAEGTPLETCVAVGTGREAVKGAGAAAAVPGVTVRALAAPAPVLELTVGEVTAAVASAVPRQAPAQPVASRRLHATGGGLVATLPLAPIALAAAAALGLAGMLAGRRTRR